MSLVVQHLAVIFSLCLLGVFCGVAVGVFVRAKRVVGFGAIVDFVLCLTVASMILFFMVNLPR